MEHSDKAPEGVLKKKAKAEESQDRVLEAVAQFGAREIIRELHKRQSAKQRELVRHLKDSEIRHEILAAQIEIVIKQMKDQIMKLKKNSNNKLDKQLDELTELNEQLYKKLAELRKALQYQKEKKKMRIQEMKSRIKQMKDQIMKLKKNSNNKLDKQLDELTELNEQLNILVNRLVKQYDVNKSTISRWLKKLKKSGLIQENLRVYSLTHIGKACYAILGSLEFPSEHREYFDEHGLGDLSLGSIRNLGALNNCKPKKVKMSTTEADTGADFYNEFLKKAEEFVYVVSATVDEPFTSMYRSIVKDKSKKIRFKCVISKEWPKTKSVANLLKEYQDAEESQLKSPQWREARGLQVSVTITDKGACILFPHLKGEREGRTDYHTAFYAEKNDIDAYRFCMSHFDQVWESATPLRLRP